MISCSGGIGELGRSGTYPPLLVHREHQQPPDDEEEARHEDRESLGSGPAGDDPDADRVSTPVRFHQSVQESA